MATRLFDKTVDLAQPEARSGPRRFGGEEWIEGTSDDLPLHACASIADRDHHELPGIDISVVPAIGIIKISICGLNGDLAALRHGVTRVDGNVENRALKLVRVGIGGPQAACGYDLDLEVLAERRSQEIRHAGDHLVDVDRFGCKRLLTRKCQEAVRQGGSAVGRRFGRLYKALDAF